jgi:hypothetical protein
MRKSTLFIVAIATLVTLSVHAQTEPPKGFKKGTIVLIDGSSLTGFVKDNIRSNASVTFITESGTGKKTYSGTDISSTAIEDTKFICISGDFFKVLCEGDLCFLQKSSDASGKPSYNGNEAIFSNGTEGKPNDYFIYNSKDKQLKLVSRKNLDEIAATCFAGHATAIEKAKTNNGDLSQLKEAVEVYNRESR